jgi:hypothetical protein
MEEEERRTLLRERKRKEEKDTENEAHETQDNASNSSFSGSCALNAEINGKFILLEDDDEKANTGGETIKPDASRIVALDDLWRKEDNKGEMLSVSYDRLTCVLWTVVKSQQKTLQELTNRVQTLEANIAPK